MLTEMHWLPVQCRVDIKPDYVHFQDTAWYGTIVYRMNATRHPTSITECSTTIHLTGHFGVEPFQSITALVITTENKETK